MLETCGLLFAHREFGAIALAMVRREIADGDMVTVRWGATEDREAGEVRGTVVALPFTAAGL